MTKTPDTIDPLVLIEKSALRIQELESGIREVIEGGYTMPRDKIWRQDGVHSKHDRCPHGNWMYDGCENCISDFLLSILEGSKP